MARQAEAGRDPVYGARGFGRVPGGSVEMPVPQQPRVLRDDGASVGSGMPDPAECNSMQYGYFDDDNREYVITRPHTPLPWINYLGCQEYFGIISNTAGGYSFYRDARLRRITRYQIGIRHYPATYAPAMDQLSGMPGIFRNHFQYRRRLFLLPRRASAPDHAVSDRNTSLPGHIRPCHGSTIWDARNISESFPIPPEAIPSTATRVCAGSRGIAITTSPSTSAAAISTCATTRAASTGRRHGSQRVRIWNSIDRKSTRLNSSHLGISYAVFCLKK